MQDQSRRGSRYATSGAAPVWLVVLALIAIGGGVYFRFSNLALKPYWHDETWTSVHVAGYRLHEAMDALTDGRIIEAEEVQRFQHRPADRGLFHTLYALAADDSKHPPLYYGAAHVWARIAGSSPAEMRAFSAAISLLALPLMYWLCLELFGSQSAGWAGAALVGVSPYHVLYAQEARQYSLWTVTTILSTAALLRAMRQHTPRTWALYAVAAASALYTVSLSVLLLFAHGLYVAGVSWASGEAPRLMLRPHARVRSFLTAAAAGLAAFVPWAAVIVVRRSALSHSTGWMTSDFPLSRVIQNWVGGISSLFADFSPSLFGSLAPEHVVITLLVAVAMYLVCRLMPRHVGILLILLLVPAAAIIVPDLLLGGRRSAQPRYWIPSYVGMQLAVVGIVSIATASRAWRVVQIALFTVLVIAGAISCVLIARAPTWWIKGASSDIPLMARLISDSPRPLIVGDVRDVGLGNVLALSHSLGPNVRLLLVKRVAPVTVQDGFTDVFVFDTIGDLRRTLAEESGFQMVQVSTKPGYWRITGRNSQEGDAYHSSTTCP